MLSSPPGALARSCEGDHVAPSQTAGRWPPAAWQLKWRPLPLVTSSALAVQGFQVAWKGSLETPHSMTQGMQMRVE